MHFTIFILVCIKLSRIEAGVLPKPYHPLRGTSRHTIRLYPIQLRNSEDPPDNYSWRRYHLGSLGNHKNRDEEYVRDTPNINNNMVLGNPSNDENVGQDYVRVSPDKNNNLVLDIVRQIAENLKTLDQKTSVDSDPYDNLRSLDSIENSKEIRSLFGNKGYVHLTYPSKQKNNMLNDIVRQMAKNLRILDETKSVEEGAASDSLRQGELDPEFFREVEIALLNPKKPQKDIAEIVKALLKSLRTQQTKSVETKDNNDVKTFDTIVHFEENPRRILDIDERDGVAFEDLNNPDKEDLVMDAVNRLAKDESQKAWDKDYEESFNMGRRAESSVTPKLVYEFNELVI